MCFQCECIHAQACKTMGVMGHAPPENFYKLYALRLLLRPFWDRSRTVVAIWIAEYCIRFLAVHVFAKPADFEFPRKKVLRLVEHQVG